MSVVRHAYLARGRRVGDDIVSVIELSSEAQRVIAGCLAEDGPEVTDEDGQSRVVAVGQVWSELRKVFPIDTFIGSKNQEPDE